MRSLLRELEEATETLLRDDRRALDTLAAAMLERETLDAGEIRALLAPKKDRRSAAADGQ